MWVFRVTMRYFGFKMSEFEELLILCPKKCKLLYPRDIIFWIRFLHQKPLTWCVDFRMLSHLSVHCWKLELLLGQKCLPLFKNCLFRSYTTKNWKIREKCSIYKKNGVPWLQVKKVCTTSCIYIVCACVVIF